MNTENRQVVATGEIGGRTGEKGEGEGWGREKEGEGTLSP